MPMFKVVWEVEVWADTPQEAAETARSYQTAPDTTAAFFEVIPEECPDGQGFGLPKWATYAAKTIDLSPKEQD